MNKDNINNEFGKIIGGYSVGNLTDKNIFFADEKNKIKLSFNIHDIAIIENSEILKLKLGNNLICRILKFTVEESNVSALTFDLVDESKKSIEFKADKLFYNAMGLGLFLFEFKQITQWEITVIDLLCRAFIFGDQTAFLNTINTFNVKLSQSADWFIKNKLD